MTDHSHEKDDLTFWEKLRRRKLRNYLFLDKRLQFNFALLLAVVGAFNAIYFSLLVYFHARESFIRLSAYIPDYLLSDEYFRENYRLFCTTIAFATIGEAVFVSLLGLFFSHRIAGPLYAMSQKLKVLSEGAIPNEVRLRKNDFLTQFAERVNQTIGALRDRQREIETALSDLKSGKTSECKERLQKIIDRAQSPGPSSKGDEPQPN